jgi:hypothetical protein
VWCGVVWCGVVWCGVVWCGVVWCGVVWCGVVRSWVCTVVVVTWWSLHVRASRLLAVWHYPSTRARPWVYSHQHQLWHRDCISSTLFRRTSPSRLTFSQ